MRVLDLTRLLPGGFCSLLLADLGADVLKVEDTGVGDYIRWAPPFYGDDEHAGARHALGAVPGAEPRQALGPARPEGGARPRGVAAAWSPTTTSSSRASGPACSTASASATSGCARPTRRSSSARSPATARTARYRERAGHDTNYLGLNGLLGLTGAAGGPPVQAAGQIADLGGGALMAAFGVMAALHERERSGEGQFVDISMTDGALSWLAMVAGAASATARSPKRGDLPLAGRIACYLPYEAADGWVSCGALEPKFWAAFCNGVERPDLIEKQFEQPG